MADLSDVLDAFVGVLSAALYPSGTGAASAIGAPVAVFPGWPEANKLDAALAAGRVMVSVFPPPNLERATTRAMSQWLRATPPVRTLTVALAGQAVTIGGTAAPPQWVSVVADKVGASYRVQAGDTPATVAAALAALLTAKDRPATSAGPTLTLTAALSVAARVGTVAGLAKEVERTQRAVMTTVWAPSPVLRKAAGRIVRARLARVPKFLDLPDGSAAWLVYDRTNDSDVAEKVALYRRDLTHWAEFGEYDVTEGYEVTIAETGLTAAIPPRDPLTPERLSTT